MSGCWLCPDSPRGPLAGPKQQTDWGSVYLEQNLIRSTSREETLLMRKQSKPRTVSDSAVHLSCHEIDSLYALKLSRWRYCFHASICLSGSQSGSMSKTKKKMSACICLQERATESVFILYWFATDLSSMLQGADFCRSTDLGCSRFILSQLSLFFYPSPECLCPTQRMPPPWRTPCSSWSKPSTSTPETRGINIHWAGLSSRRCLPQSSATTWG